MAVQSPAWKSTAGSKPALTKLAKLYGDDPRLRSTTLLKSGLTPASLPQNATAKERVEYKRLEALQRKRLHG